jgi:hypothetical protein
VRPARGVSTGWDTAALQARIADHERRVRHPAGSPDAAEIAAYDRGLGGGARGRAVVLGMTPELRRLATRTFADVVSVDVSSEAIAVYGDWLTPAERTRERVVRAHWLALPHLLDGSVDAVLGDGVFGNLPDVAAHAELLAVVRGVLAPAGRFVTRHALIPRAFDATPHTQHVLLQRHRAGELDEAEFGFGVRLLGHHDCCYDPSTGSLDNARLFAEVARDHARGLLTDAEHAAIRRYTFAGRNCILGQETWEALLGDAGFAFRTVPLQGRAWYAYYPVFVCAPADGSRGT